jgi:hypothetical protein
MWGHEKSPHDDVRWGWNQVHEEQSSTIVTPKPTMHKSLGYIIAIHPAVLL